MLNDHYFSCVCGRYYLEAALSYRRPSALIAHFTSDRPTPVLINQWHPPLGRRPEYVLLLHSCMRVGRIADYKGTAIGNYPEYCECYGGRERRPADDYAVLHKSSVGRCVGRRKMVRNLRSPIRKMGTVWPCLYMEGCVTPPSLLRACADSLEKTKIPYLRFLATNQTADLVGWFNVVNWNFYFTII